MEKEPSDKLACLERHGLLAVMVCIVAPQEGNIVVTEVEDAVIADGDSVSISAQVLKNTFGAIEGRFAIDDPFLMVEVFSEGFEVCGIFEMTETVGKDESIFFEVIFEKIKELASEQRRHHPYGKKKSSTAWFPGAIGR
jgi:hypothetical protein